MKGAFMTVAAIALVATGLMPAPVLASDQALSKIAQCWNVGSLSAAARKTEVTVAFDLSRAVKPVKDTVTLVRYRGGPQEAADEAFRAARRAILRCGSNGFERPAGSYAQWRKVEITFNPESMR